ncbi:hypothetical protein P168DRAFT_288213 [Aspergillus campestris IBT 28561]|uniref:Eukaryotic mitochondrial regulator protein-domain-containing protein n=1 Tax=Aspergillus campestris (strain IBT 28561) TaxID=1392248 RepID=A0A2I1D8S1_ASPC2|nr:uncharacterized protein P168DRAFT_288213 [Aspergillus campestris IBT 28561]PKY06266.1 hypothetical protein P168DRAFT_288213 [Aspergillus campestris IBT 28561]
MPPRIHNQRVTNTLLPYLSSTSTTASSPSISRLPSTSTAPNGSSRPFSTTPAPQSRKWRTDMFQWLAKEGSELKSHVPGRTNYLTRLKERRARGEEGANSKAALTHPFPLNPYFSAENILSEELRNEIHARVTGRNKKSVRAVSVELGVDMRRVAAVVRLVELEKRMKSQNKQLALPYARAVHEMVPTTPLHKENRRAHESINDLPVHKLTNAQIFHPIPESRHFTRADAGRVFSAAPAQDLATAAATAADPTAAVDRATQQPGRIERVGKGEFETQVLQPAEARIPHPHLVALERYRLAHSEEPRESNKYYRTRLLEQERLEGEQRAQAAAREEQSTNKVAPAASRFEFRFRDVEFSEETVGHDGRGSIAPGRRYGVPSEDRKKGQVKIPTSVVV